MGTNDEDFQQSHFDFRWFAYLIKIIYLESTMWLSSLSYRALKSCGPGGTAHVKLVVEWDKETKDL